MSYGTGKRVLLVDDDAVLRSLAGRHLQGDGYWITEASSAAEARISLARVVCSLVVLDVMMPGETGLTLCKELAEAGGPPVILLTAVADEADRIAGLDLGADDYVTKPFAPAELSARIRAVLRRTRGRVPKGRVTFAGWTYDRPQSALSDENGISVPLGTGEARLLEALLDRPGETLSRDQIMYAMQGRDTRPFERSVDITVARLRRKLEDEPAHPKIVKTVRGGGYRLAVPVMPA